MVADGSRLVPLYQRSYASVSGDEIKIDNFDVLGSILVLARCDLVSFRESITTPLITFPHIVKWQLSLAHTEYRL